MDNNLPNDPPVPQSPPPMPPNPSFPTNPQNPTPSSHYHQVQSELASHRHRDAHGHFVSEHPNPQPDPAPQTSPTTPSNIPNPSSSSNPPNPIPSDRSQKGDYPPLFQIANPVTYLKRFWDKVIKKEGIKANAGFTITPLTAIAMVLALGTVFSAAGAGIGYGFGFNSALGLFFPNSSPVFHREINIQGTILKTEKGTYYITALNNSLWKLQPKFNTINLSDYVSKQVILKGNLTKEKSLIEVSEIIAFDTKPTTSLNTLTIPNPSNPPNPSDLPELYSSISWETTQTKVLTFTSGKRRIEQEGVYLESAKLDVFPYDFINYYITQLKGKGFKQTLNKIDPDGITTSFEKTGIFLTFGVKNVYSGSGDNKKLIGYKAFIEHN